MALSTAPKILRVGVIQGGKIVEERYLRKAEDVTVGPGPKNTLLLPTAGLPQTHTLFAYKSGQYQLLFTDQMTGRVRLSGGDLDFAALRAQGLASRQGEHFALPLSEQVMGKVMLGSSTVLFQFVTPPEVAAAELPAEFKNSVLATLDRPFLAVLAASLLLHFLLAGTIALSPKPPEADLAMDELPDRFAKVLIPAVPPPKKEEKAAVKDEPKETQEKVASKKESKPAADSAERKAAIANKVAQKGLLKILGSSGNSGSAFANLLGDGNGTNDIASALAGAGGVGVATTDLVGGGQKGGGAGNVAGIGDLGTNGGGNVNLGNKREVSVAGRVKEFAPEVDSSDVDRDALARYVKARLKAIQNCYEKELKRNPSLKGKVVVRFSIGRTGRVSEIDIEENTVGSEAVGSCIRTVIRAWIFPFKPDSEVPVAYPFVFSPAS